MINSKSNELAISKKRSLPSRVILTLQNLLLKSIFIKPLKCILIKYMIKVLRSCLIMDLNL